MATVYAEDKLRSKRHYIATANFNSYFHTYTVSLNSSYVQVGTFGLVTSDSSKTPAGRILRETGSKLYPGAHPSVNTIMVKVYDSVTNLNGFIDPNAPCFCVFNSDKPVEFSDGGDDGASGDANIHLGPSVFTRGVIVSKQLVATVASGLVVPDTVTGAQNVYLNTDNANNFNITLSDNTFVSSSQTYIYFGSGTGAQVIPASGQIVTLYITNGLTYASPLIVNQTYTSVGNYASSACIGTVLPSKTCALTFISDGSLLYLISTGNAQGSYALPAVAAGSVAATINTGFVPLLTQAVSFSSGSQTLTLNRGPSPAPAGTLQTIIFTMGNTNAGAVAGSTNIRMNGNMTLPNTNGYKASLTFISDGTNLIEVARVASIVA